MLAITGVTITDQQREPLLLFANQIALAVERAQLREEALRAQLTQEVEQLARTLVAAVSHDLRSPLASIKASSSVLADADLAPSLNDSARGELARLIDTQTDRLAALVTNLLDMSRVQAGVLHPRTSLTTASDLVTTVLQDLPGTSSRQIITEIDADLPLLDVDTVLIGRVLTNLLDNASRYAPPGTPITIRAFQDNPATVTVSRRPGARHSAEPAGRGLRLLLPAAERHRDRTRTGDRQDLHRSPPPEHLGRPEPRRRRPLHLHPAGRDRPVRGEHTVATVLIVDDDIALLAACRVGLEALGHQVRTAETGQDGLAGAAVHAPDVIVLDLGLPDLDGLDVCTRIRTWTDRPIIILSADSSEDRKVDALDNGAGRLHDQALRHA
ncbi:hybrid sensor histidine kinase/response regulator [Streptomyces sp. T1317-0309]|nr:hybrid sensor histidine kinase/response regulator [Streptomyces sp. T1317-0309]